MVPSSCAPAPNHTQAKCSHPYECIRWSANAEGHYGKCKACELQHVIYYHGRHGALVTDSQPSMEVFKANKQQQRSKKDVKQEDSYVTSKPGEAVADSGCRCAVAGVRRHQQLQEELKKRRLTWVEVEEKETFRFGSGDPEESVKAFIYPVGIYGQNDLVRISCVGGGATLCPGLVGPSELSRWEAVASFAERSLQLKGVKKHMRLTPTRHPAINLLDFKKGTEGPQFWSCENIKKTLEVLKDSPQTWAFISADHHEETSSEEEEDEVSQDGGETESDDGERKRMLRGWMDRLDQHLAELPIRTQDLHEDEDEEDLIPGYTTDGTVTSHEFGIDLEESEDESEEEHVELVAEEFPKKMLSKHEKRRVTQHLSVLNECYEAEKQRKKKMQISEAEVFEVSPCRSLKGRRFTILEVFTWSCMVSLVAVEQG